jgi:hypothetical protein
MKNILEGRSGTVGVLSSDLRFQNFITAPLRRMGITNYPMNSEFGIDMCLFFPFGDL